MEPDDLEARVSALEGHVGDLDRRMRASEHDAAAARVLAGAADRDVADFGAEIRDVRAGYRDFRHATTASFNALREDMTDLRADMINGFTEMRGKFDAAAAGQQHIVDLIEGLAGNQDDNGPARR